MMPLMAKEGRLDHSTRSEECELDIKHIKILQVQTGLNNSVIANKLQLSKGAVCNVLRGRRISPQIRERIAELFGLCVQELFRNKEKQQ